MKQVSAPPVPEKAPLSADLIAASLKRHGVEVMFSQSLPSRVVLACEDQGIRQITYRTENAGGAMADAYARISHRIGVVCAQNGPAATLLVPPLAEALKSSVPVLALVQEVNRPELDRNAFQELDHLALFAPCAKWVRRVWQADRVEEYLDMAVAAAASGRPGPAVLLFPADLLNERVPERPHMRKARLGHWPLDRVTADPMAVAAAASLLCEAEAPLVIAGGGVHSSGAADELAALQELACLPVGTTVMGKGAVADAHPLSLGLLGNAMGQGSLGELMRPLTDSADVVLLAGTRTDQNATDSWRLPAKSATTIHLDLDGQEVGRNYDSVRLVGDAKLTLAALLRELQGRDLCKRQQARKGLEAGIARARQRQAERSAPHWNSSARPIRPERVMRQVSALLSPDSIVVADASYSSIWTTHYLPSLAAGMRFLTPRGLAGLGWGLPMAIGAKQAAPDSRVICLTGDGGFGHVWAELETAARIKANILIILLNNGVLGYQKHAETVKYGRCTGACHFSPVDHAAIARACGCQGQRIEDPEALEPAFRAALTHEGPTLIEVLTDPAAYPPLTLYDGSKP